MGPKGCDGEMGEECNALLSLNTAFSSVSLDSSFLNLKTLNIPRHTLNDLNSVQAFFTSHKCDAGSDMTPSSFRVRITSTSDEVVLEGMSGVAAHSVTLTFMLDETEQITVYAIGGGSVMRAVVGTGFDEITVSYEAQVGAVGQQFCSRLMVADLMGISTLTQAM